MGRNFVIPQNSLLKIPKYCHIFKEGCNFYYFKENKVLKDKLKDEGEIERKYIDLGIKEFDLEIKIK